MNSIKPIERSRSARLAVALAVTALVAVVAAPTASAGTTLTGKFSISTGSYFRMQYPGGSGWFSNPYSTRTDKTYTAISSGTDGGITSGLFQGEPAGGFDKLGNSLAGRIITPTNFAGVKFGLKTFNSAATPAPAFVYTGSVLSAKITGLTVGWNKLYFNQGLPKPGKTTPLARGTYNASTKAYTLDWSSPIIGGPFNGFTGVWHLTGTFTPRA